MDKPREIFNSQTEDPSRPMYKAKSRGEPGTGLGSVGPANRPEIGTSLGGHGNQPIATSFFMHVNIGCRRPSMGSTAVVTIYIVIHMQDTDDLVFVNRSSSNLI